MADRHVLQLNTYGLSAVIGINRAHTVVDRNGAGVGTIRPINEWVMPGENTLDILLAPAEGDPGVDTAEVKAALFVADPARGDDAPATTLVQFAWPLPPPARASLPYMVSMPFAVTSPPPTTLWVDAPVIADLTEADRNDILAVIERYRAALLDHDASTAFTLMEYRYRDVARAHGHDQDAMETSVREHYAELFARAPLHCPPLSRAEAVFTLVGAGKVVMVNRGLGTHALHFESGTAPTRTFFDIGIHMARIDGLWTIVR